ncbi:MAG: adenylate/guanylate cyclase domain-containing protein [Actinomycetota bacterium]|nr:adenylate/guanylate cyclase domain-containing protein [Actinomycetota bacterium]
MDVRHRPPAAGTLPTGIVTFLFTDIEGSTRLVQCLGNDWHRVVERHHLILRRTIRQAGGLELSTEGDSFFAVFTTPADAVGAAVEAQRALSRESWPERARVRVRMGIHTGRGVRGGDGYVGLDVHRAARIAGAAHGGQVLISGATRALVENELPEGIDLRDLGAYPLKDIERSERLYQLVIDGLPSDFPPLRTAGGPMRGLPTSLSPLVGREREVLAAGETLRRARLLTLAGPGGVGKTRLALEIAARINPRPSDGFWLVDLELLSAESDPAAETARTLGVQSAGPTAAVEALCHYLAARDVLMLFDNCEHVIASFGNLATELLVWCPGVRILATSREPLGIDGETVWRLDPLEPEDAQRLFVERARQRRPDFVLGPDGEEALAQLCTRLDHLPLGIELAAARITMMSVPEILSSIESSFGELGAVRRQGPAHHRSVRAAVEWSYQLLDPTEQEAFRHLAVFVGGFDAEAAKAVAPGLSLGVLARLVDKSVVAVVAGSRGRTRYRMLETVREYAHELLVAAGELDAARQRHFRHFLSLASETREASETGDAYTVWPPRSTGAHEFVDELEADYGNVRAALEWAAVVDPCAGLRLLSGMMDLFLVLGQADGRRLAEVVLERCPARTLDRVNVQISAGALAWWTGDPQTARRSLAEARQLSGELGERALEGWAWILEGLVEVFGGSAERARRNFEQGRRLHHELGVRAGEARASAAIGLTFMLENDSAQAQKLVEEALELALAADDGFGQGQCHTYLGMIAQSSGEERAATSHYRSAVACLRPYRDVSLLPISLVGQALVLARRDPATALRVAAAASAVRARVGGEFPPLVLARVEEVRRVGEAALGAEAGRLWKEGPHLSVEDAIALAFGDPRPRPTPADGLSGP